MTVLRIFNEIKINSRILDRNFTYEIIKSLDSIYDFGNCVIKKEYLDANDIEIKKGDEIVISTGIEKDDLKEVFKGVVISASQTKTDYHVTVRNNLDIDEKIIETLEDTDISEGFKKLGDVDFKSSDIELKKVVFSGIKRLEFLSLFRTFSEMSDKKQYCYYDEGKIIITDTLSGQSYTIDDNIYKIREDYFEIFPIPRLKVCDTLVYKDVSYSIDHIVYKNKSFKCGVFKDE